MIVHHGSSTSSGHYIAYVKSAAGQWFIADDSRVASVRIEQVLKQQAYILMYVRGEPRQWRLQGAADASAAHASAAAQSSRAKLKGNGGTAKDPEQSVHREPQKEPCPGDAGVHSIHCLNYRLAVSCTAVPSHSPAFCKHVIDCSRYRTTKCVVAAEVAVSGHELL